MANLNRRLFSKIANSLLMGASSMGMRTPLAQPISNKPVKVVVPYSPGGGTDVIGRSLLQNMSGLMGQAFILDNKPGAGTVIGTDYVAKSEPDGKTLLLTSSAVSINASLIKNLPYNTLRDLAPIARICEGPNVIVVRADSPFLSIGDVIRSAKEKPN